jgi:hypothetical protein
MSKTPLSQQPFVRFREGADSHKYNEHVEQVFYDLTELYNLANQEEKELQELREFHEVASHFGQEQIDQLKRYIEMLKEDIAALQKPGVEYIKYLPVTAIMPDEDAEEHERCVIDKQHDVVHLPNWGISQSKLYLYDDLNDEYIVPNTLKYNIEPEAQDLSIQENDFMNCITPDEFKFWHRKYTYLAGLKSHVQCTIQIDLPDNIISSRDVNTIYIHPFPLNTMDILNVEYKLDGGWRTIPGFQKTENIGNMKFCFSPTEMKSIRITLRQRHFVRKGSKDVFHIGLRQIGVEFTDYQTEIGRFEIPVEFSRNFIKKEILDIRPVFQNEESLSVHQEGVRLATFKIYELDDRGRTNYLNDTFPVQIKERRIILKGILSMDRNTRSTPALKGVEIVYKGDS